MDLNFAYVTSGLLCLILIFLFLYYRNEKEKVQGFPFYNFILKIVLEKVRGKIPKDVPLTSYVFSTALEIGKQYAKEGLLMTYCFRPLLFVFGEEEMKFFLNEKAALDKSPEYDVLRYSIGDGILSSNGERWKKHRKLINPVFHMGMLKDKVPHFNEHAAALVKDMEKLAGKPSVDIFHVLQYNYFNALSESIFGLKQGSESKEEILRLFYLVDSGNPMVAQRMFLPWLRSDFLLKFFSIGRAYLKANTEFKNFVTKGYHTTTYTTLWCLFMLALHPEVQEKAFNEIQSLTNDYVTYEDCCSLTYLETVILETLRLYPPAVVFSRVLSEDVQYSKYKVHKGTTIVFVPYMSQRNPDIFPDPEKFDPERFSYGEAKRAWSFVPFSEGSRSCIGKKYALIEMKIFLSYILRNFKISSLDTREDIRLSWTIFLTPERPIRMKITPRHAEE